MADNFYVTSGGSSGGASEATLQDVLTEVTDINSKTVVVDTDNVTVVASALPTGAATEATLSDFSNKSASGLVPEAFDSQVFTYVGATTDISTITYKLGATTVATVTFAYDGSNRIDTITKT